MGFRALILAVGLWCAAVALGVAPVAAGDVPVDTLEPEAAAPGPAEYLMSEVLVVADRPERFDAFGPGAVVAEGARVSRSLALAEHAAVGDYGTSAFPSFRGLPAEHVAIEYDGVPLNSVQNGTFDLALLDLLGGEATVARGPFAWLGASGASQAAIAVAPSAPSGVSLAASAGGNGGAVAMGVGGAGWSASLSALGEDLPRDGASLTGWSCRATAATVAGELGVTYLDARRGLPGAADAPWSAGVLDDEIVLARFRLREIGRARPTVYATRHEQRYEDSFSSPTHVVSSAGAVLAADITPEGPVRSLVAASYDVSRLDSHDPWNADIGRRSRGSGSVVARAAAGRSVLRCAAQCGLAHTTDFGAAGSGALGIAAVGRQARAWASVGTAYRPPTMNELHWPADPWTEGNPDLSPERVVTVEAGGRATAGPVGVGITAYRSSASDLIVWSESGGVWRPENVGEAALSGVEFDASARLGPLTLSYAADLASARDEGSGLDLPYRPRAQHTLAAEAGVGRARLEARLRRSGEVFTDAANTQTLAGHTVVDAAVELALPIEGLSMSVEGWNLFDERYETRRGYELSGRVLRAALLITQSQKPW